MRFETTIELGGKTATGFEVPDEIVEALGSGRRPAVTVTVRGHTYRSTVAVMGGRYLVPLSAEHRASAGVAAGDNVEVEIELDTAERVLDVPDDLPRRSPPTPPLSRSGTRSRTAAVVASSSPSRVRRPPTPDCAGSRSRSPTCVPARPDPDF